MRELTIYADGSVRKSRVGGWAYIILEGEATVEECASWEENTTNNRMELEAVIHALENVPTINVNLVTIWSDSQYVIKAFTDGWLEKWKRNNWYNNGEVVKNKDLWVTLDCMANFLQEGGMKIEWKWCRGHNGDHYNEVVDKLAQGASKSGDSIVKSRL